MSPPNSSAKPPGPQTWNQFRRTVREWAVAAGEDPEKALRELDRGGAFVRAVCAKLGVERPVSKSGRRVDPSQDRLVIAYVEGLKRDGLRGRALWEQAHLDLATTKTQSLFGENRGNTPAAIERYYQRAKRRADKKTAANLSGDSSHRK
ncbi:hypothetical protein [Methylobacterium nodulans]|uniref:Uncharacterized protein n=1 Tax=Methylobacterium nodulans (strain LMG 21967 / CNCM I-2342 / ORS 2060) TaxID=460265 RepID=B8IPM9_METNO|nr:hypothetical protein [Methylobacterium nodulans]ACL62321.1 hypothetical protein Mnod_7585 [Methylobacterium nodulans ORS 2060]